ncbi:MAG: PepSY domain-containing protein [Actinomycetaceae bacterium]|nr:PepSY domain-containing protein [Actinomycetaceae bacterium]
MYKGYSTPLTACVCLLLAACSVEGSSPPTQTPTTTVNTQTSSPVITPSIDDGLMTPYPGDGKPPDLVVAPSENGASQNGTVGLEGSERTFKAIALAEETARGRALAMAFESATNSWVVTVISASNQIRVQVTAPGQDASAQPPTPASMRTIQDLSKASITITAAITAALEASSGSVKSATLVTTSGDLYWQIVLTDAENSLTVKVDATTGSVTF